MKTTVSPETGLAPASVTVAVTSRVEVPFATMALGAWTLTVVAVPAACEGAANMAEAKAIETHVNTHTLRAVEAGGRDVNRRMRYLMRRTEVLPSAEGEAVTRSTVPVMVSFRHELAAWAWLGQAMR